MSLLICGDFGPTKSNLKLFEERKIMELFGSDLISLFRQAHFKLCNLETPLTDTIDSLKKGGPCLASPTYSAYVLNDLGFNLVGLANNHILDQGIGGLHSTIDCLEANGINHFGAGENIKEASDPFVTINNGKKYGFYACAEHEFSYAHSSTPGANPYDSIVSFSHVSELKKQVEYCVVLYHGGKEYYRYPSPELQRRCRMFVDSGADLVVCQHSHCIGCKEEYNGGVIVYGQGNFLFDRKDNEFFNSGLLIYVDDDGTINYVPVEKCGSGIRLSDAVTGRKILDDFFKRSSEILDVGFIEKAFDLFANSTINNYLLTISGQKSSILYKIMYKIFGERYNNVCIKQTFSEQDILALIDYFDCEAHRETILAGLRGKIE